MTGEFGDVEVAKFQIGIAHFGQGWNVIVQDPEGGISIFEPTFPSEAEAQELAGVASRRLLSELHERGFIAFNTDHDTGEIIE